VQNEAGSFIDLLRSVYADFGFNDILVKLSTRPLKRIGDESTWDTAESALTKTLNNKQIVWELNPGEGAFYGPKIEFSLKDSLGRVWQCGTLQLDFALPERLGAEYVAEDNARHHPVMLHRAVLGSLERFIGILIEHYAGALPVWLAPIQVVVLNISESQSSYASLIEKNLKNSGFRAISDLRNEKISYKIREHSLKKLPFQLVVGDKEVAENKVAVRTRKGKDLGQMSLSSFISLLNDEIALKGRVA
jgi:threonyl-tRNA synthetase